MIREYVCDPPLTDVRPGDTLAVVAGVYEHRRNGALVAFRVLGELDSSILTEPKVIGSTIGVIYLEERMPGQIATLTDVIKNNATGVVRFKFADGTEREFTDEAAALGDVEYLDTSPETVQDVLILKTLRNSPDFVNLETMLGTSAVADFNNNTPISIIGE